MIELEPEYTFYKEIEKEFENKGLELIGIKYINEESIFLVRKIN